MFENGKVYRLIQQNGSNEWIMDPLPQRKMGLDVSQPVVLYQYGFGSLESNYNFIKQASEKQKQLLKVTDCWKRRSEDAGAFSSSCPVRTQAILHVRVFKMNCLWLWTLQG